MIKEWLLVVMMAVSGEEAPNLYIFEKPTFDTVQECQYWTNTYPEAWIPKVAEAFPNGNVINVLCVKDIKLRELVPDYDKDRKEEEGDQPNEDKPNVQPNYISGEFLV